MYILNDDTQNYLFFRLQFVVERLDTQLNELNNKKNSRTSVINIRLSPPTLYFNTAPD